MKISVIQLNNAGDVQANLRSIADLVDAAVASDKPDLVVLPEMSACRSSSVETLTASAEPIGEATGPAHEFLSALASRHGINLITGSSVERSGGQLFNTGVLIGRDGQILTKYRKIHRFDVTLPDGTAHLESSVFGGGTEVVTFALEGVTVGFTICYDLRFPVLFKKLAELGADIIVVPAAFHFRTGVDHWEVLLRARAIETQCYVVAPDQTGSFDNGAGESFGHSMILDPWGMIVAQVSHGLGYASARFDRGYLEDVRRRMPILQHQVLV
jgi:predicted amidohydrolase